MKGTNIGFKWVVYGDIGFEWVEGFDSDARWGLS